MPKFDRSGLKEACERGLAIGRTRQEFDLQLLLDMLNLIEQLESPEPSPRNLNFEQWADRYYGCRQNWETEPSSHIEALRAAFSAGALEAFPRVVAVDWARDARAAAVDLVNEDD